MQLAQNRLFSWSLTAAILGSVVALAGCGSDDTTASTEHEHTNTCGVTADEYTAAMTKMGAAGKFEIMLMESNPGPPIKGENTWMIHVMDMAGAGVPGATVTVTPFMPEHGHGSPIDPVLTDEGDGMYMATPISFSMPGIWENTITANDGAGNEDSVVYTFCIDSE